MLNFIRFFVLCSLVVCVSQVCALEIHIKNQVTIATSQLRLGDCAEIKTNDLTLKSFLDDMAVMKLPDLAPYRITPRLIKPFIQRYMNGQSFQIFGEGVAQREAAIYGKETYLTLIKEDIAERLPKVRWEIRLRKEPQAMRIAVDESAPVELVAEALSSQSWGPIGYRIRALRHGQEIERQLVLLILDHYRPILKTTVAIPMGVAVDASMFTQSERLVRRGDEVTAPLISEITGAIARMPLQAGQEITWRLMKKPPLVRGGQLVTVEYSREGFSVSLTAQALSDGYADDSIALRIPDKNTIIRAEVIAPGKVRVH